MVDTALAGFGPPTSIVWPRHSPGYDAAQEQSYTFDLGKARQLLDAAGWDANTSVPLALTNLAALNVPMAEIYEADLATIGVKLEVQKLDNADFFSRLQTGKFGTAWMTSMSFMNLSPATFLSGALTVRVPNTSHFETPRYRDLIVQANALTDDQLLKPTLQELTQIMLDESFVAVIAEGGGPVTGVRRSRGARSVTRRGTPSGCLRTRSLAEPVTARLAQVSVLEVTPPVTGDPADWPRLRPGPASAGRAYSGCAPRGNARCRAHHELGGDLRIGQPPRQQDRHLFLAPAERTGHGSSDRRCVDRKRLGQADRLLQGRPMAVVPRPLVRVGPEPVAGLS